MRGLDELDSIDRAIAALQAQRSVLGSEVVETALAPLRERRTAVEARLLGEQRKLVTVLFADLVDFTTLSRGLDAEDTRAVVNQYFEEWQRQIEAHGGVVEKFIGDAVMAVFGLYRAQEDDPQQAIRAALAMREALTQVNAGVRADYGVMLRMRVGVDTGDVVVSGLGERPGHEFVAVGDTVNRASRLQSAAPADGVLISSDTYRHVRGLFGFTPMPGLRLKGIDEHVDGYLVLGERPKEFRLDPARGVEGVQTSTVGRDIELRRLQEHFADVTEDRQERVVTLVGDAGVGKSRLLLEFDRWLAESPDVVWWFRARAWHSGQNLAGAVLRDLFGARFGITDSDPPDAVREKCIGGFEDVFGAGLATTRRALLVATWLGFELGPDDDGHDLPNDPRVLRDEATAELAAYFARLAATAPVVMLLEDLHWADDGSLDWIDATEPVLRQAPVLVVATARPAFLERRPHWGEGLVHHARLQLEPLSRRESRALLGQLMRRAEEQSAELTDLVVTAAEGNPFYIEELVKWLLDTGVIVRDGDRWHVVADAVGRARVPITLKGLLQARVDSLSPPQRAVLQRASVIGRVFWDDAVEHLAPPAEPAVTASDSLRELREREVVYERERSSFDSTREFLFKHALLREVAYEGVLRARRQTYHGLAAEWLEQVTERSHRADEYAALIAEHYDRAGSRVAAHWYLRAARQSASLHALAEAARLVDRGLDVAGEDYAVRFDLLATREELLDRQAERPAQREALAAMDAVLHGRDDPPRRVKLLLTHARWAFMLSEFDEATEAAGRAAEAAAGAGLAAREAEAQLWRGKALTWKGDNVQAREALTTALVRCGPGEQGALEGEAQRYLSLIANNEADYQKALDLLGRAREAFRRVGDLDGESRALAQFATVYYNLGRFAEARTCLEESLPIFQLSGDRYREAVALGNLASIAQMQGELAVARRWAREGLELSLRVDDRDSAAGVLNVLGEIAMAVADWQDADAYLAKAIEAGKQLGEAVLVADSRLRLALSALDQGRISDAGALADRAVEEASASASPRERAHTALGRGYVRTAAGDLAGADADFTTAREGFDAMGVATVAREAVVGLAAVALARGDARAAAGMVELLLPELTPSGLEGSVRPGEVLRTCRRVLEGVGDPRADEVTRTALAYLAEQGTRIGDDELRAGFLRTPQWAWILATGR